MERAADVTMRAKVDEGFVAPLIEYLLEDGQVSPEAVEYKHMLYEFLTENSGLIENAIQGRDIKEIEEYMSGFKQAVAMVNLWIDCLNIAPDELSSRTAQNLADNGSG